MKCMNASMNILEDNHENWILPIIYPCSEFMDGFCLEGQMKRKLKVETIRNHKGNINLVKVFYPVTLRILGFKNAPHLGSENTSPPLRPLSLPQNHGVVFGFQVPPGAVWLNMLFSGVMVG